VTVPPICSQLKYCFPKYGNDEIKSVDVDKAVDELCGFSPQVENVWEAGADPHSE